MIIVVSLLICFSLSMSAMEVEDNHEPLLAPRVMAMSDFNGKKPLSCLPYDIQNVISQLSIDKAEERRLTFGILNLLSPHRVVMNKPMQGNKIDLRDTYPCCKPDQFEIEVDTQDAQQTHRLHFKGKVGRRLLCGQKCCPGCIFEDKDIDDYANSGAIRAYNIQEGRHCCLPCIPLPPEGIFLLQEDHVFYHQFGQVIRGWGSDVLWVDMAGQCVTCCTCDQIDDSCTCFVCRQRMTNHGDVKINGVTE